MGIRREGGFIILFSLARAVVVFRFESEASREEKIHGKNIREMFCFVWEFVVEVMEEEEEEEEGPSFFFATKNPESLLRVTFARWSRIEFLVVGD